MPPRNVGPYRLRVAYTGTDWDHLHFDKRFVTGREIVSRAGFCNYHVSGCLLVELLPDGELRHIDSDEVFDLEQDRKLNFVPPATY